jgi:hypothetical protein
MTKAERIHQELRIARLSRLNVSKAQHPKARAACIETAHMCLAAARRHRLTV